jgi:hypothetical protein
MIDSSSFTDSNVSSILKQEAPQDWHPVRRMDYAIGRVADREILAHSCRLRKFHCVGGLRFR